MKTNKIIIILLTLTFLNIFSFIHIDNVKATSIFLAGFENSDCNKCNGGGCVGQNCGSGTYYHYESYGGGLGFTVSNNRGHTGDNSLKLFSYGAWYMGWLNFTSFSYMSEFSFWVYTDTNVAWKMYLYNQSANIFVDENAMLLKIYYLQDIPLSNWRICFVDSENNINGICYAPVGWYHIVIKHTTLNNINFSVYNEANVFQGGRDDTITSGGYNWTTVKSISWYHASSNSGTYFDDFACDTGVPPSEGEEGGVNTYEICNGEGISTSTFNMLPNSKYIESYLINPITGSVDWVELLISATQYNFVSNSTFDYTLYVSGENWGTAISITPVTSGYKLRWENIGGTSFVNQNPVFAFGCNKFVSYWPFVNIYYWYGVGVTGGNQLSFACYHNDTSDYTNIDFDCGNIFEAPYPMVAMCFHYNVGGQAPSNSGNHININVIDSSTGNTIPAYNMLAQSTYIGLSNYVAIGMTSDLWTGYYNTYQGNTYYSTISPLYVDFTNGYYHELNFINISGKINGKTVYYNDKYDVINSQWYNDSTYTVILIRKDLGDFYTNKGYNQYCVWFGGCLDWYVESDKYIYQFGETVRLRYKCPSVSMLDNNNQRTSGWYLCLFQDKNSIFAPDTTVAYAIELCILDNEWHLYDFVPPNPTDNVDEYKVTIQQTDKLFIPIAFNKLSFKVYNEGLFYPFGNITSISPSEPKLNQLTTISFDANNDFILKIRNIYTDKISATTSGVKPFGIATFIFNPQSFGYFVVELYVYNGYNYSSNPVDTAIFYVNTTNGSLGDFGTGEFLYVTSRRVIADFDTVEIIYHSLKENATLTIRDSVGQTYPASTIVGTTPNVLYIELPPYAEIGEWNITLEGNKTHYATFNVIAEEGNYIEFTKNIFYDNEYFYIFIMHSHKIALEFYKDNEPQGTNYILEENEIPTGIINIPTNFVYPSIGNWDVELWEVNNNIRIKKLAEASCKVVATPKDLTVSGNLFGFDILGYILTLPIVIRYSFGIIITLIMCILPFIIMLYVSRHSKITEIKMPSVVYLGLFMFGEIVSVLLKFFDWFVVALTLLIVVLGFVIDWLRKKNIVED